MKRVLISTGGSGGHVNPALSLFDHFKKDFKTFLASDVRGLKFIDEKIYKIELLNAPRITKNLLLLPYYFVSLTLSILKAYLILKKNEIDLLISTGGYMSLPFCISAKIKGINIILFEPNMFLGRSNKFFLKSSKKIVCYSDKIINFPKKYNKKIFLTQPILKKSFYPHTDYERCFVKGKINLLVLGGSQGAKFFDNFCEKIVIDLSKKNQINVVQQVFSRSERERLKKVYNNLNIKNFLFDFDPNISDKLKNCDIAITRCGASTMAELAYLRIPFIGIPYPYAKDNHQFYNLEFYEKKNCCWAINQKDADTDKLVDQIQNIFNQNSSYKDKINNMDKISYQNSWNNINKKLIKLINEN